MQAGLGNIYQVVSSHSPTFVDKINPLKLSYSSRLQQVASLELNTFGTRQSKFNSPKKGFRLSIMV